MVSQAVASVFGTNGMPQPTGTITLAISGDNFAAIGARPIYADIGTVRCLPLNNIAACPMIKSTSCPELTQSQEVVATLPWIQSLPVVVYGILLVVYSSNTS